MANKKADDALWAAITDWTNKKCAENITAAIEAGADPNKARKGLTPLFALLGHSDFVEPYAALLDGGADTKKLGVTLRWAGQGWGPGDKKATPLHMAVCIAHRKAAEFLIERGVPLEAKTAEGRTALHLAAKTSGMASARAVIDMLLEKGADVNAVDKQGKRPVDYAASDVRETLLRAMTPGVSKETRALIEAIQMGEPLATIEKLLAKPKADPSAADHETSGLPEQGVAAVHAIFRRDTPREVIDRVLAVPKIDVNARTTEGKTPLFYLIRHQQGEARRELLKKLLAMGADPNARDQVNQSALWELVWIAERGESLVLLRILLAAKARVTGKDTFGNTLLEDAFETTEGDRGKVPDWKNFPKYVKALVDAKAPARPARMKAIQAWIAAKTKS
jgi:ankyrin repeat protein